MDMTPYPAYYLSDATSGAGTAGSLIRRGVRMLSGPSKQQDSFSRNILEGALASSYTLPTNPSIESCALELLDTLTGTPSIQKIIDIGYKYLGNPIRITDASFRLIALTKDSQVNEPLWNELALTGENSWQTISMLMSKRTVELVNSSKTPIIIGKDKFDVPRMVATIAIDEKMFGNFAVIESERPFGEDDPLLVILLCNAVSWLLKKGISRRTKWLLLRDSSIIDLLDGRVNDIVAAEDRLHDLGFNPSDDLYVMTFIAGIQDSQNIPYHYLRDILEGLLPDSRSTIYDEKIVALISRENGKPAILSEDINGLSLFLEQNQIYCGISRCCNNILELQEHNRQSFRAAKIGSRTEKNGQIFFYDDYAIADLLDTRSESVDLRTLCHSSIFVLLEYDEKNGTDNFRFLRTYLQSNGQQKSIAENLHLHRNTIRYRINTIERLMNIDLGNPDIIFHLQLTLKILETTQLS